MAKRIGTRRIAPLRCALAVAAWAAPGAALATTMAFESSAPAPGQVAPAPGRTAPTPLTPAQIAEAQSGFGGIGEWTPERKHAWQGSSGWAASSGGNPLAGTSGGSGPAPGGERPSGSAGGTTGGGSVSWSPPSTSFTPGEGGGEGAGSGSQSTPPAGEAPSPAAPSSGGAMTSAPVRDPVSAPTDVPAPAGAALVGLGAAALAIGRRRKRP